MGREERRGEEERRRRQEWSGVEWSGVDSWARFISTVKYTL